MVRIPTAVVVLVAALAAPVRAQCVIFPLQHYLADDRVAAMLQAHVVKVSAVPAGQVATVDVLRLWKGQVRRRITIYNLQQKEIHEGEVDLQEGVTYLVIAHVLNASERADVGVQGDGDRTLGTSNCAAYPFGTYSREILGDAPGYEATVTQRNDGADES